mmetsp:Transcript_3655/g.7113  ORF Transcript_3655/g.7113 Transcript_3655/m.7113 type:complete len:222 (-) Transcript_3655:955-1620(-)
MWDCKGASSADAERSVRHFFATIHSFNHNFGFNWTVAVFQLVHHATFKLFQHLLHTFAVHASFFFKNGNLPHLFEPCLPSHDGETLRAPRSVTSRSRSPDACNRVPLLASTAQQARAPADPRAAAAGGPSVRHSRFPLARLSCVRARERVIWRAHVLLAVRAMPSPGLERSIQAWRVGAVALFALLPRPPAPSPGCAASSARCVAAAAAGCCWLLPAAPGA